MTALFAKQSKTQNQLKFRTTKELLENLYNQKAKHEKHYFDYEKQLEAIHFHALKMRNEQKYHKEKIYALEKEIKKHSKPKHIKPKHNYTSFYAFAGLLIFVFLAALYVLFTNFLAI